jgi:hypothetical protein
MDEPTLTLDQGRRPALFRQLTVEDGFEHGAQTEVGWAMLRERYAHLVGLSEEDYLAHPDCRRYQREQPWRVLIWPAIIAAFTGPGARPTVADLARSHRRETLECAREVLRLNAGDPDLADLAAELALWEAKPAETAPAETAPAMAEAELVGNA